MTTSIPIKNIDLKGSPVVRSHIREDVVAEYALIMEAGKKKFPPIDVFTVDDEVYYLADGSHRTWASIRNKCKVIDAMVHKGSREDALRFALTANERHGVRRTNEDKRFSIAEAIKQWPKCSDNQIAAICVVDNHTVKDVRDKMEAAGEVKPEPVRTTSDGKERKVGKSQSEPKPKETGKSQPKALVDDIGTPIPEFARQFWDRTAEVEEILATLKFLHKFYAATQKNEDLMYGEINFSAALADLEKVITNTQTAVPYAVCTTCQGQPKTQPKGECRMCKGRGLISKFRWNTLVPAEIKNMKGKKA
jgi:hypothetical protein